MVTDAAAAAARETGRERERERERGRERERERETERELERERERERTCQFVGRPSVRGIDNCFLPSFLPSSVFYFITALLTLGDSSAHLEMES
jgi:hypothetical protein